MNQANLLCHKMKIPETLDHLIYCLTKEILCKQPENVHEFAADFFHQLVEERNGTNRNPFPESHAGTSFLKPNSVVTISTGRGYNDQLNEDEEIYNFEKELLLNEDNIEREVNISPPPTLDESLSDHDSSPVTIAAIVTSKTLESPRNVSFTSLSQSPSGVSLEIRKSSGDFEEATDSSDMNCQITSTSMVLDSEPDLPLEPIREVSDEMNLAAIQIQSAYRGHRARKENMVTNHNIETDIINITADFVDNNKKEFEEEFFEKEVEKTELEDIKKDSTQGIDDNVEKNEEVVCTYTTDLIDSTSFEKMPSNTKVCNSTVLEEIIKGKVEDEIDYTEQNLGTQMKQFAKTLTDDAVTDPIDWIEESNEENQIGDNILETNFSNSDNPNFASEAMQTVSTMSIESITVDQENYEDVRDQEDQGAHVIKDEFGKNDESETNEHTDETDVDDLTVFLENNQITGEETDNAQGEDYQKFAQFNIETPNLELEKVQAYIEEGLKIHCDEPLTEDHDHSDDYLVHREEKNYSQYKENTTTNDITLATGDIFKLDRNVDLETETKDFSDSDVSQYEKKSSSSILNENYGSLNQPIISRMTCQETNLESAIMDSYYNPSASTFITNEEIHKGNTEGESNSEISYHQRISEEIYQETIAPQESALLLGHLENYSNLSDNLNELAQNKTNLVDDTSILESKMIKNDKENHLKETKEEIYFAVESDHRHDTGCLSEIENDVIAEQGYNGVFGEGDQETSNDDEEEIWSKLQKDIELEEQQQNLAAIKIQSTFRGYKTRKDFNLTSENTNEFVIPDADIPQLTNNYSEENISGKLTQLSALESSLEESQEENNDDDGLSEALAGITEKIATVALFMTDTPQPNSNSFLIDDNHPEGNERNLDNFNDEDTVQATLINSNEIDNHQLENNRILDDVHDEITSQAILINSIEANDVKEEPMSNGEEINNIQLIDSYVIFSSIADSPATLDTKIIEEIQENETTCDGEKNSSKVINENTVNESVASDPEMVFELFVESNETTNDGLLESYWQPKEHSLFTQRVNDISFEQDEILTMKRTIEHQDENVAAIQIQAGYRGYQDRKRVKQLKDKLITNSLPTNKDETFYFDESLSYDSHKLLQFNEPNFSSMDLENAAEEIQAGYHEEVKNVKDKNTNHATVDNKKKLFENTMARIDSNEYIIKSQQNLALIEQENIAATKIQAGYRGHQDRKRVKHLKDKIANPNSTDIDETQFFVNTIAENDSNALIRKSHPNLTLIEEENFAATKIQASYRGHQERKRVKILKDQITTNLDMEVNHETTFANEPNLHSIELENAAATKIQAGYRGHQDRKRVKKFKDQITNQDTAEINETQLFENKIDVNDSNEFIGKSHPNLTLIEKENIAATKIQAGYRGHHDRKRVKYLKEQMMTNSDVAVNDVATFSSDSQKSIQCNQPNLRIIELENAAATKIQAGYRGHQERKRVKKLKDQITNRDVVNINEMKLFENAMVKIDSNEYVYESQQNLTLTEQENIAATKIQAGYRGHQDRKRVKHLKDEIIKNPEVAENDKTACSSDSQKSIQCNPNVHSIELENEAATKIQAGYRGHQERKRVKLLKDEIKTNPEVADNDEIACSSDSQKFIQCNESNLLSIELENAAATNIQAGYRGHQERKRVKHLKDEIKTNPEVADNDEKACSSDSQNFIQCKQTNLLSIELENAAATKIQAGYRGHQERKRVKHLKDEIITNPEVADKFIQCNQRNLHSVELENAAATKI